MRLHGGVFSVIPFRRRCPPRNCTRRCSASSRHRGVVVPRPTNAANPRRNGVPRCPIRYSASPVSTCSRGASSSDRRCHHPTAVAVPWPLPLVASSCVWCVCSGTRLSPANEQRTYKRTNSVCRVSSYFVPSSSNIIVALIVLIIAFRNSKRVNIVFRVFIYI